MCTINNKVLESFRKKLSNDQLIELFDLLNRINFNRTLKSKGGSVGSLMDTSLNQPLKINKKINENFTTETASSLYGFTKFASEKLILDPAGKKEFNFDDFKSAWEDFEKSRT